MKNEPLRPPGWLLLKDSQFEHLGPKKSRVIFGMLDICSSMTHLDVWPVNTQYKTNWSVLGPDAPGGISVFRLWFLCLYMTYIIYIHWNYKPPPIKIKYLYPRQVRSTLPNHIDTHPPVSYKYYILITRTSVKQTVHQPIRHLFFAWAPPFAAPLGRSWWWGERVSFCFLDANVIIDPSKKLELVWWFNTIPTGCLAISIYVKYIMAYATNSPSVSFHWAVKSRNFLPALALHIEHWWHMMTGH